MYEDLKAENDQRFASFVAEFELDPANPEITAAFGDPENLIVPFVKENDFDVTVMSTIAPTGFASRLLGSTIENVLVDLPTNLLAVKPPGFVSPVKVETEEVEEGMGTEPAYKNFG